MISVIDNRHAYFFEKGIREMKPISLSIFVVNCKDYVPSHNWYLCKSGRHFSATAKSPDSWDYDEDRLNEYNASDDYILMPECTQMTDEEAAEVVRNWCRENNILYDDDLDEIEKAYHWYYKYGDYGEISNQSYIGHLCGCRY